MAGTKEDGSERRTPAEERLAPWFADRRALDFLADAIEACGPRVDDLTIPVDELGEVTIDDMRERVDAFLDQPGARVRLQVLAAQHLPEAERARVDGVDSLDTRAWRPASRDRHVEALRAVLVKLRSRIWNLLDNHDADRRVSVQEAIDGVPDLDLPATPRTTLYGWLGRDATARVLGVDSRGKRKVQRPLVRGLRDLQAARPKRMPRGWRGKRGPAPPRGKRKAR